MKKLLFIIIPILLIILSWFIFDLSRYLPPDLIFNRGFNSTDEVFKKKITEEIKKNNIPHRILADGTIEYRRKDNVKVDNIIKKITAEYSTLNKNNSIDPEITNNFEKIIDLVNNNEFNVALEIINKMLDKYPKSAVLYSQRGFVKGAMGDDTGNVADLTLAIKYEPDDSNNYYNRGSVRARTKDYENALLDFNKVIEIEPDDIVVYLSRGHALYELGRIEEAIDDYKKYIKSSGQLKSNYKTISPVTHIYLDLLATYFAKNKNFKDAVSCEERAIKVVMNRNEQQYLNKYQKRLSCYKNNESCE